MNMADPYTNGKAPIEKVGHTTSGKHGSATNPKVPGKTTPTEHSLK
jgi:hypothetical protein